MKRPAVVRPRPISIVDRVTGQVEQFTVTITDDGIREWLAEREQLRVKGYPDRPPDRDTETLRVWEQHPGEADLDYFRTTQRATYVSELDPATLLDPNFHGLWRWDLPDGGALMVFAFERDGRMHLTEKSVSPDGAAHERTFTVPDGEHFEKAIYVMIETLRATGLEPPRTIKREDLAAIMAAAAEPRRSDA